MKKKSPILALVFVFFLVLPALACEYTFTTIDCPFNSWSSARDINDSGQITGQMGGGETQGWLKVGDTYTVVYYPGSYETRPTKITNDGAVYGGFMPNSGGQAVFRYLDGIYTTVSGTEMASVLDPLQGSTNFHFPGATSTSVNDGNDSGQVVGSYVDAAGNTHGFFFDGCSYITIDAPNSALTTCLGINNHDDIVGYYLPESGPIRCSFLATPVPLPSTLLLLGSGLLGLGGWRRSRKS